MAIARALANDPPILIADEPTGRLDSTTAETVFRIFLGLVERGKTIVMVTHDQGLARRASRVIRLADEEIVPEVRQHELPAAVQAPRRAVVRRLFGWW